jgi:RNA-binding protein
MITSKQRSALKALANKMEPIFQLGKGGITDNFVKQIDDALEARELIKGSVLRSSPMKSKEALHTLCEMVGADPVCAMGSRMILYRKSKTRAEHIEF